MTRLFLAAGVAALAISAPASAQKEGKGRDRGGQAEAVQQGGGGGGGGQMRAQRQERRAQMPRMERRQERQAQRVERREAPRMERRMERQAQRVERREAPRAERRMERQAQRVERREAPRIERSQRFAQQQERRVERRSQERRLERAQARQERVQRVDRRAERQAMRVDRDQRQAFRNDRQIQRAERQAVRNDRFDNRVVFNRDTRRAAFNDDFRPRGIALNNNWCPPGLADKGCMPPGQARKLLNQPLRSAAQLATLSALPATVSYLYPDTDDYYYRYGGNYVYRVDRDNDIVSSLLPLLAGGLMPGQLFPTNYTSSFVPAYFDTFYQDTPNVDYRYAYGNVYAVDPYNGYIDDVIPTYGYGYGVGQALPAGYGYYNVPYQYRDVYYNTPDQNYWYSPGAIYQVDPTTSLITAVASLLAPGGLSVGQALPMGYSTYNVPLSYRDTYYDTPNAWYRYNNGYIYQVDPTTQLVTAIVASILT